MHSVPSHRVKTSGYFEVSRVKRSVAPSLTWRFTLLFNSIAPVMNSPREITTRPPPAFTHAAIAAWSASVLSVWLSPLAPYLVISNSRDGNLGGLMRARIRGTSSHTAAELGASERDRGWAQMPPLPASTLALIPILRKLRRVVITLFLSMLDIEPASFSVPVWHV